MISGNRPTRIPNGARIFDLLGYLSADFGLHGLFNGPYSDFDANLDWAYPYNSNSIGIACSLVGKGQPTELLRPDGWAGNLYGFNLSNSGPNNGSDASGLSLSEVYEGTIGSSVGLQDIYFSGGGRIYAYGNDLRISGGLDVDANGIQSTAGGLRMGGTEFKFPNLPAYASSPSTGLGYFSGDISALTTFLAGGGRLVTIKP